MASSDRLRVIPGSAASLARKRQVSDTSLVTSLDTIDAIIPPVAYPKGAVLFMEGQVASGIFALCTGLVKLSMSSPEGKALILKIAHAGELLGLAAILSGKPYEVTAQVSQQARATFIPRITFLRFLRVNPLAAAQATQLLIESHYDAHAVIRSLELSPTAPNKLARFFLGWSAHHAQGHDRLQVVLTHEEIGQMIGTSRETVTRLVTGFKKQHLLTVKGATVDICNRAALQVLADN
jgi:CRP/FNR family cyclic AMP-dependent transcriptional regulator